MPGNLSRTADLSSTILTKRLENAGFSSMVGAVAMQKTSKLRQNATKNVTRTKDFFQLTTIKLRRLAELKLIRVT